ncbi:unnamed protein product [Miscanthus lutarioriparius]|uniref:Uncharacterized protein n=1 Tax=Miscanthus lutarioriparius TaxID=422564 RepID=A0A811MXF1_9POAL|nr:unnamed protein product [Miscanthus lutarioriparius]
MCYQVKCGTCGKPTWAGCGRHVASVHAQIPEGQHCACRNWPGVAPAPAPAVGVEKKAAGALTTMLGRPPAPPPLPLPRKAALRSEIRVAWCSVPRPVSIERTCGRRATSDCIKSYASRVAWSNFVL